MPRKPAPSRVSRSAASARAPVPRARTSRTPSELEAFTLGLIWQLGPCSPYEIRTHMRSSPSSQWSASAGAIYPLMRRLERAGLVRSKSLRTGKRERQEYTITEAGITNLRAWIGPPFSPEVISVTHDPLRTRARFLALVPPATRKAWLASATAALEDVARRVARWQAEHGHADPFLSLITRNGELETQARRQWLAEMTAHFEQAGD
jgi:DNA-binding PadR family transcriptional regulator